MDKSYTEHQQISYFEVDSNLFLTPSALVFHLQDTAIRHSASLGYTLDYMAEHHRGWAVVNWHIIIDHMPKCGENIKIVTWSSKCRRMQAERSYLLYDQYDNIAAHIASRWIFMDLEERKPTTIGNDMEQKYGNTEITAIENEKYKLPKMQKNDTIIERTFIVTRRDTDNNGHTNNVKYIEWAIDDIPDDIYNTMTISDIRVVYRKECYKGDAVTSKCCVHTLENGIKEVISFFEDGTGEGTLFAEVVTQWKNNAAL